MNAHRTGSFPLAAAFAFPILTATQGQGATVISDDFSANILSAYTNPSRPSSRSAFTYDTANQRVNGDTTGNAQSVMANNTSFGNSGADPGFNLSFDFLTANGMNTAVNFATVAVLGISDDTLTFTDDGIGFEFEIRGEFRTGGAPSGVTLRLSSYDSSSRVSRAESVLIPRLADGTWHTMSLNVSRDGLTNGYGVQGQVTTQADPGTVIQSISDTVTHADLSAASDLFAGLGVGINGNSGGAIAADNFSVVPVPEPSAALLGGLGCLLIGRRRRRR